jgi:diaminohydroxyphosphoribosylaminopyrimidine deaminase / 5-amino-6-(5-phosphoribosylamino)uracil reductase
MLASQYRSLNPHPKGSDAYWIQEAFFLAQHSFQIAYPNPPVGALLVGDNDQILASSFTQSYGSKHAERILLETLPPAAIANGRLFSTLSPCTHQGKQPACSEIILKTKPKSIVSAYEDPNPLVKAQQKTFLNQLRENGIDYRSGELGDFAVHFYKPFTTYILNQRPFLAAKWAVSLDFAMADSSGVSKWITNAQTRSYTHWLRRYYHAILLGAGSVLKDNPRLNSRMGDSILEPVKIIYDPKNQLTTMPTFWNQESDFLIAPTSADWLNPRGFVKLDQPLDIILETRFTGIQSILVEGGPQVHRLLLSHYDRIHAMVAPKLVGSSPYRAVMDNALALEQTTPLRLVAVERFEDDVVMEYER